MEEEAYHLVMQTRIDNFMKIKWQNKLLKL